MSCKECATETKINTCSGAEPCNSIYDCECEVRISTDCVHYAGPDMEDVNVFRKDLLTDMLIKFRGYIENVKNELYNKLNIHSVGTGLEVYLGENKVGIKEFRSLKATGGTTIDYVDNEKAINIHTIKPIAYNVLSNATGQSLIQKTDRAPEQVDFFLKGIATSPSIDVRGTATDVTLTINETYMSNVVDRQVNVAVNRISGDIETFMTQVDNKVANIENLVNSFNTTVQADIEASERRMNLRMDQIVSDQGRENIRLQAEIQALNIPGVNQEIAKLKTLTNFIQTGLVVIWNRVAVSIPEGWRECTDLKGRVPVGVGTGYEEFASTGGNTSIVMNVNQLPAHGHPWKYMLNQGAGPAGENTPMFTAEPGRIPSLGDIMYTGSGTGKNKKVDNPIMAEGENAPIDIKNPYRVVNFIEYVG